MILRAKNEISGANHNIFDEVRISLTEIQHMKQKMCLRDLFRMKIVIHAGSD